MNLYHDVLADNLLFFQTKKREGFFFVASFKYYANSSYTGSDQQQTTVLIANPVMWVSRLLAVPLSPPHASLLPAVLVLPVPETNRRSKVSLRGNVVAVNCLSLHICFTYTYCIFTVNVIKIMSNICSFNCLNRLFECCLFYRFSALCFSEVAPMMAKTIKAFKNRFSRR